MSACVRACVRTYVTSSSLSCLPRHPCIAAAMRPAVLPRLLGKAAWRADTLSDEGELGGEWCAPCPLSFGAHPNAYPHPHPHPNASPTPTPSPSPLTAHRSPLTAHRSPSPSPTPSPLTAPPPPPPRPHRSPSPPTQVYTMWSWWALRGRKMCSTQPRRVNPNPNPNPNPGLHTTQASQG